MMKNFKQFNMNESLKIKDIISIPKDIVDIFNTLKNEIDISNNDILVTLFYSRIYLDCLLQYNNLTSGRVDIISDVRKYITKSNNELEVKRQYKNITKPTHIIPASLLKMLNDYKFDFNNDRILDTMINLVEDLFTNSSRYSFSFKRKLLNSKIEIKN